MWRRFRRDRRPPDPPTTNVIDEFLSDLKDSGRGAWTIETYLYAIRRFAAWTQSSGVEPTVATDQLVRTYLRRYPLGDDGKGSSSRHFQIAVLRAFFAYLVRQGARADNPAKTVPYPPSKRRPPRIISREEEAAIFKAAHELDTRVLLELMRYSGLRVGEVVGRRRKVYDPYLGKKVPHISPGLTIGDLNLAEGLALVRTKGNHRTPRLLDTQTIPLLRRMVDQLPHRQASAPLFQDPQGAPRGVRWAENLFRQLIQVAAVPRRITPHMLRHTFATRFLEAGGNLRALQKLMGHKRLDSTLIYADFVDATALRDHFNRFSRKSVRRGVPNDGDRVPRE